MIRPLARRRSIRTIFGANLVDAGINIFINGISGVFFGMAVLYLTIKIIALLAVDRSEPKDKG
jgi:hypothetical protein